MEIVLFLTMTMPSLFRRRTPLSPVPPSSEIIFIRTTRCLTVLAPLIFFLPETDVSTQELHSHGINASHFCQMSSKNPAGHCYITFSTDQDVIVFVKSLFSSLVVKHLIFISCLLHAVLLSGIMVHLLNCLMKLLHTVMKFLAKLNTTAGHFTI